MKTESEIEEQRGSTGQNNGNQTDCRCRSEFCSMQRSLGETRRMGKKERGRKKNRATGRTWANKTGHVDPITTQYRDLQIRNRTNTDAGVRACARARGRDVLRVKPRFRLFPAVSGSAKHGAQKSRFPDPRRTAFSFAFIRGHRRDGRRN